MSARVLGHLRRLPAAALVLAILFPVFAGVWGIGILLCLDLGFSDRTARTLGLLAIPAYLGLWFLLPVVGRIAGFGTTKNERTEDT